MNNKYLLLVIIMSSLFGAIGGIGINSYYGNYFRSQNISQKIIQTEKIELINKFGNKRGVFEVNINGPSLSLFAPDGQIRAELWLYQLDMNKGHVGLNLNDIYGKTKVSIMVGQSGEPIFNLFDNAGNNISRRVLNNK